MNTRSSEGQSRLSSSPSTLLPAFPAHYHTTLQEREGPLRVCRVWRIDRIVYNLMALASPAIFPPRLCSFSGIWDFSEGRRRPFLFTPSAASLLCGGTVRADGHPRIVSECGLVRAVSVKGDLQLSDSPVVDNGQAITSVEIPVTCYQVICLFLFADCHSNGVYCAVLLHTVLKSL